LSNNPNPQRGEVWLIRFDPTEGDEIKKTRPAVIVSSDALRRLSIRLVAPLTGWQPHFAGQLSHVKLTPGKNKGVDKESAVDALQLRGVSLSRCLKRLGVLSPTEMQEIASAIALVVEYQ